jgi:hypothetical protein
VTNQNVAHHPLHFSLRAWSQKPSSSTDPSGCVVIDVFVDAVDGRVKEMPGGPGGCVGGFHIRVTV